MDAPIPYSGSEFNPAMRWEVRPEVRTNLRTNHSKAGRFVYGTARKKQVIIIVCVYYRLQSLWENLNSMTWSTFPHILWPMKIKIKLSMYISPMYKMCVRERKKLTVWSSAQHLWPAEAVRVRRQQLPARPEDCGRVCVLSNRCVCVCLCGVLVKSR